MEFLTEKVLDLVVFSILTGIVLVKLTEAITLADTITVLISLGALLYDLGGVWLNYKELREEVHRL